MHRQLQFQGERTPSLASKISITSWFALGVFGAGNVGATTAQRIAEKSLGRTVVMVDVVDGIESTLAMLAPKLVDVEVVRAFGADVPNVEVYASELNQVWTNLIDNAIDAMAGEGQLSLRASRTCDGVEVEIADNVIIDAHCIIKDSRIASGSHIKAHSLLDQVQIGESCEVGPFARLRPGTVLAAKAKIGNFVETKKTLVGEGSKISHLSYVGDAILGRNVNVGASGFVETARGLGWEMVPTLWCAASPSAHVTAEAVLVHFFIGFCIPKPTGIRRNFVGEHNDRGVRL